MTGYVYLPTEEIVAINADQDGGVGVADHAGIDAAAARPASRAFGTDAFPSLWAKAAAYVHAFATTQYFTDGNKRTAWFAAMTFLRLNGHPFPLVPDIEAETFVQGVAQKVFDTEDEPNQTIDKAAEWFRSKWEGQRNGPAIAPQMEWVFLARGVNLALSGGIFDAFSAGLAGVMTDSGWPFPAEFAVVGRFHPFFGQPAPLVTAVVRAVAPGAKRINRPRAEAQLLPTVPSGHPYQQFGAMPHIFTLILRPVFLEPVECVVDIAVDGRAAAQLPLDVWELPNAPDYMSPE